MSRKQTKHIGFFFDVCLVWKSNQTEMSHCCPQCDVVYQANLFVFYGLIMLLHYIPDKILSQTPLRVHSQCVVRVFVLAFCFARNAHCVLHVSAMKRERRTVSKTRQQAKKVISKQSKRRKARKAIMQANEKRSMIGVDAGVRICYCVFVTLAFCHHMSFTLFWCLSLNCCTHAQHVRFRLLGHCCLYHS